MNTLKKKADDVIETFITSETKNKDIYKYIFEGGKRLRQMIVFAIAEELNNKYGKKLDVSDLSIGIEMIHTSSLIIDDLPCMDNDDYRRGKLTAHKKYSVSTALQLSMVLIRKALQKIFNNLKSIDNSVEKLYLYNQIINENLGKQGLPMGQFIDINFLKNKIGLTNEKDYKNLIYKKTTTLFNLSFILTYILFDTNTNNIALVSDISKYFGIAFQLYDDFTDIEQDQNSKTPNYIIRYGCKKTYYIFLKSIVKCNDYLDVLQINNIFFKELFAYLDKIVNTEMEKYSTQFP